MPAQSAEERATAELISQMKIMSIGMAPILAEMLMVFYQECQKQGFSPDQAFELTRALAGASSGK
jgi:hypothetical protein